MNPDKPSRDEIEARLTALLLGELPEEEARLLRYTIAQDPELTKLHDRLKATIGLVRHVSAKPLETAPLKLSDDRRQKLLAHFKTPRKEEPPLVKPLEFKRVIIGALVTGTILGIIVAMLLPALSVKKMGRTSSLSGGGEDEVQNTLEPVHLAQAAEKKPEQTKSVVVVTAAPAVAPPPPTVPPAPQPEVVRLEPAQIYLPRGGSDENSSGKKSEVANEPTFASGSIASSAPEMPPQSMAAPAENGVETGPQPPPVAATPPATESIEPSTGLPYGGESRNPGLATIQADQSNLSTVTISGEVSASAKQLTLPTHGQVLHEGFYRVTTPGGFGGFGGSGGGGGGGNTGVIGAVAGDGHNLGLQDNRRADRLSADAINVTNGYYSGVVSGIASSGGTTFNPSGRFSGSTLLNFEPGTSALILSPDGTALMAGTQRIATVDHVKRQNGEVPVVGDVPLVGSLFSSKSSNTAVPPANTPVGGHTYGLYNYQETPDDEARDRLQATRKLDSNDKTLAFNWNLPDQAASNRDSNQPTVAARLTQMEKESVPSGNRGSVGDNHFVGRYDYFMVTNSVDLDDLHRIAESASASTQIYTRTFPAINPEDIYAAASRVTNSNAYANDKTGLNYVTQMTLSQQTSGEAKYYFKSLGVDLDAPGKEVYYNERNGTLTVKGTVKDLAAITYAFQTNAIALNEPHQAQADQAYFDEKRKLDELNTVHELLGEKIKAQSIDANIPRSTMVEITDVAQPGKSGGLWDRVTGKVESTARIKVENEGTVITGMQTPAEQNFSFDAYAKTTEQQIQSQDVLGNAVDKLGLQQKWANGGEKLTRDEAITRLKGQISLSPIKDTQLVAITAASKDPKESALLANTVAEAYRDYRLETSRAQLDVGLAALKEKYANEATQINQMQARVDSLAAAKSQPTPAPELDLPLRKSAPNAPIPQPEVLTTSNAFSTFAMNVSDVSYKLAAASLEKGLMPDASSIRSEEFINAFDYRDPEAAPGQPIAFASERVQNPFEQNRDFLRFSIKTAASGRQQGRPLNLVLLLDNSGSMERADRVAIIREALRVLASQLSAQDTVSIVTFSRTARLWQDGISGDKVQATFDEVSGLTPQGGTNLEEAMRLAYETARRHYLANGMNRVVLLTDGAANLGNVDAKVLVQKAEENRRQGIALDCFGIGWEDYNDNLLEQLTSHSDGRYAFLNSPAEASTEFAAKLAGALQVAAEEVKVQVEFNPDRVIAHRQIGYATHQLTKEQFRDNTVAAGEIASQEAGNALYTVELKPDGSGPIATVRLRYRVPGTSDYQERSWNVDYTGRAEALDKSSPAMRLAVTSAEFAEWLATSPYAQQVSLDQLLNDLRGVPEAYGADARPKQLEWMIRQAKSVSGK